MGKVTKDMGILDIVQQYPEAVQVFQQYGMGCLGCAAARFENLEAGAKVHGFDPDQMVADINALIEELAQNNQEAKNIEIKYVNTGGQRV
jgi:hybrid cluster-associated redox disulfide protein